MYFTGLEGKFTLNGESGTVRNAEVTIDRPMLDTTTLDTIDATYIPGTVTATGTATFLYSPGVRAALLQNLVDLSGATACDTRNQPIALELLFDSSDPSSEKITGNVFLTSAGVSVQVDGVVETEVNFQFNRVPVIA
jgi:hypothetical protein